MNKRLISSFISIVFLFTSAIVNIPQKTYAYQTSSYYNNIRIGLKSMAAASLTFTLNGVYSVNGQAFSAGNSYTLTVSNGKIIFNGSSYDSFTIIPSDKNSNLSIKSGTRTNKYLGSIQFGIQNGVIFPINNLNIEDYLKGVVGIEMSDYFPIEALKSQAVSARNYTLSHLGLFNSSGYDLTDSSDTQAYIGYNEANINVNKAVNDTRGMVQLYNDALVEAYYSASNGGYEESSDNVWVSAPPYLKGKPDPFDTYAWPSGNQTFTSTQIDSTLKSKGYLSSTDKFVKIDLTTITRYASGRISNIDILYTNSLGTELRKSFTKTKAYSFLNLPSSLYTVTYNSSTDSYLFSGMGSGHGVGLSQIGAKTRAENGQAYTDILNFYFDGSYTQSLLPSITGLSLNRTSTIVGQAVSANVTANGGSGSGYLYKYVVTKDSTVVLTQNYTGSSIFNYSPASSGNYNIDVYVKDSLSTSDFDIQSSISFTAYSRPAINSLVASSSSTLVNQAINFSNSVSGGSGSGYLYKYVISNNGTPLFTQDYSTSSALSYNPTTAGNYALSLYVKDKVSTAAYDATANMNFIVYSAPQISSTAFTGTLYEKRPVTIASQSQYGSTALPSYRFEVYTTSGLAASQDFSTASSFTFTPAVYGSYTVKVLVKDKISNKTYDDTKQYAITIQKEPVVVSKLPIYYGMKGTDVAQVQKGLTDLGYNIGTIDGIFGGKTYNAVVSFQKSNGLSADGVVGSITLKAINDALISKITGIK